MRLDILEHGHRLPARVFQKMVRVIFRQEIDDVSKTAMYRPQFFGRPLFALGSEVLRGPSYWTAAEREYMAVFSSRLNECAFCVQVHSETTRIESGGQLEPDSAPSIRPQLAAVLGLLGKVSLTPEQVTPDDVAAVRSAGVPDDAIVDALHVNLVFNTLNRLGNAFDWTWDSHDHVRTAARAIHLFRYKLPSFVMR